MVSKIFYKQMRRYTTNLYRKWDNKIKLKDKLKQYEAGKIDIKKLELFIEQQRERDKQMSTIIN